MSTIGCVVLSYNKAWIFARFWESLKNQSRRPDQVVLVDDGSTDGTIDLVRGFSDERSFGISCLVETNRRGQSAARNVGLGQLHTDYAIFLDGDLTLQVNMLGRMEVELEEDPGLSFVYSHYDRTGAVAGKVVARPWSFDGLKAGNFVSPMSLARRRDLPTPCFDEFLERYEDWDLWLRMGKAGKRGKLVDEVLFTAHYRPGDLSSNGESQDHFGAIRQKHGF